MMANQPKITPTRDERGLNFFSKKFRDVEFEQNSTFPSEYALLSLGLYAVNIVGALPSPLEVQYFS